MVSVGDVIAFIKPLTSEHDLWHVYSKADNQFASGQGGVEFFFYCSNLWCRTQTNYRNMCNQVLIFWARNFIYNSPHYFHILSFLCSKSCKTRLWFVELHLIAYTHAWTTLFLSSYWRLVWQRDITPVFFWVVIVWVYSLNVAVHIWPLTFIAWMSNVRVSDNQSMTSTGGITRWVTEATPGLSTAERGKKQFQTCSHFLY